MFNEWPTGVHPSALRRPGILAPNYTNFTGNIQHSGCVTFFYATARNPKIYFKCSNQ